MLNKSSIKIYARVKPTTEAVNYYDIGSKDGRHESLIIHTTSKEKKDPHSASHTFKFQKVFRESAQQDELFNEVGRPVVEAVFSGYNGAILAYGQTGTGKTHSISGGTTSATRGMIPRAFQQIFDVIAMKLRMDIRLEVTADLTRVQRWQDEDTCRPRECLDKYDQANNSPREFAVAMSTLEIYNEQCIDLLSKDAAGPEEYRVELREDAAGNVRLRNLKEYPVRNMQEVEKYLIQSMTNRVTADTPMNQHSSRSHCIFTLYLRQRVQGERKQVKSKLHMIDLSGSERVWKNRISGHLLYEAKHINLSLHYLEQVIIALNDPKRSHVPYRNSSITNFLRDSLGGNSRTAMVFTISLEPNNFYETLSTCRFSQRVSLVKNHTKKVIEYDKDEELDFLRLEVERLKRIIAEMIGEDQMRLRLSASEESVPYKPNAPLWIKSSSDTRINQVCQKTNLTTGTDLYAVETAKKLDIEAAPRSPSSLHNVHQPGRLRSPSRDAIAKSSHSGSTVPSECSSSDESDDVTKLTKKSQSSSVSSTHLDEIYSLLSNDDPQKSDVLNINKLLSIIGLDLPFSDRNSGRQFTDEDRKGFRKYIELPQNREVLKVYVRLSVMFLRHEQNEKMLIEKARTHHVAIKEAEAKLEDEKDDSQAIQDLKDFKMKQETKYKKYFKLIMKSKKKRFYYIKIFTQTRHLIAEVFQDWRHKHQVEDTTVPDIDQEMARLDRWVHALRHPSEVIRDDGKETTGFKMKEDEDGMCQNDFDGNSRCVAREAAEIEEEQEKDDDLNADFQRLDNWVWNLRNQPCEIPVPDVTNSRSISESFVDDFRQTAGGDVKLSMTSCLRGARRTVRGGGDFCA